MKMLAGGTLRKMKTRLESPVSYKMSLGSDDIHLNPLVKKKIKLKYLGRIYCIHCGRKSNKSFNQGYCYPCFQKLAQCDSCIIHPEKCHFEQGTCREPVWGEKYCMQDHIVYLANSSGLKVGITRATQIPTRWIDQGAAQALAIIRVRSRLQSGILETMFKQKLNDKTNWRNMLRGEPTPLDIAAESQFLIEEFKSEIDEVKDRFGIFSVSVLNGIRPVTIKYPVEEYPKNITSFNFDKEPEVQGKLVGIKGQYLIFDSGVINLRRFSGYEIELSH
ncbi:MAG: hypothetical protein CMQ41_02875 [Gammaproteobacteria bacterium]|nr:hypothetical protein [Gammaproteobacteria bacterium]